MVRRQQGNNLRKTTALCPARPAALRDRRMATGSFENGRIQPPGKGGRLISMRPRVPLWAKIAAYAVPVCVLPSALWRFYFLAAGPDPKCVVPGPWWEPFYIASLSIVSFGASLLTIGLVSRWGEVFPAWLPVVGGRRVPVMLAVIPASIGAVVLLFLTLWPTINSYIRYFTPVIPEGCVLPWEGEYGWVVVAAYAPVVLWAPLLALVTFNYYRRRTTGSR